LFSRLHVLPEGTIFFTLAFFLNVIGIFHYFILLE
jgi:hypothetical protein